MLTVQVWQSIHSLQAPLPSIM